MLSTLICLLSMPCLTLLHSLSKSICIKILIFNVICLPLCKSFSLSAIKVICLSAILHYFLFYSLDCISISFLFTHNLSILSGIIYGRSLVFFSYVLRIYDLFPFPPSPKKCFFMPPTLRGGICSSVCPH